MRKEIFDLDNVVVGDKLNDNLSNKYFKVIGVSDNFIVAIQNMFGDTYYTIYSKNKAEYDYNLDKKNPSYRTGEYYRGPDNKYCAMAMNENTSEEDIAKYLNMFETKVNDIAISRRNCVALTHIYKLVKKDENRLKCVCREMKEIEGLPGIKSGKEYNLVIELKDEITSEDEYHVHINKNNWFQFSKKDFDYLFYIKENE